MQGAEALIPKSQMFLQNHSQCIGQIPFERVYFLSHSSQQLPKDHFRPRVKLLWYHPLYGPDQPLLGCEAAHASFYKCVYVSTHSKATERFG